MSIGENMEILDRYDTTFFEKSMAALSISLEKKQICQFLTYYKF